MFSLVPSLRKRFFQKRLEHSFRVVSIRGDGLCMRINTILDVMLIAGRMGVPFAYYWDESEQPTLDQQTTASLAAVFDRDFRLHHLPGMPDLRFPVLDRPLRDTAAVASARTAGEVAGRLYLDQPRHLTSFFAGLGPFPVNAYAEAFRSIGFAEPIRKAIVAAHTVPVTSEAVAIHIRGGDILHGTHSFHGAYLHKAPSLAEIDAVIVGLQREGRTVWLIGQEPDVQAAMVMRHTGTHAFGVTDPLTQGLTPAGAVLFDAVFMSRVAHIFGGNSGVTHLSRRLGGAGFTDIGWPPTFPFDEPDLRVYPVASFAEVSPAAKAHAYSKVVVATPPDKWEPKHLEFIRAARSFRPINAFLHLVEVCLIARVMGAIDGERAARAFLTGPSLEPGIEPDMGLSFLMGGTDYFPVDMIAGMCAEAGPATALLVALGKAISQDATGLDALISLVTADAALKPASINPALRKKLLFCLNGDAANSLQHADAGKGMQSPGPR